MRVTDLKEISKNKNFKVLQEEGVAKLILDERRDETVIYSINEKSLPSYCCSFKTGPICRFQKVLVRDNIILVICVIGNAKLKYTLFDKNSGNRIESGMHSFYGAISDAAWISDRELWIWIDSTEDELFKDIYDLTGQSRFIFAWKFGENKCHLVKDKYLMPVLPDDIRPSTDVTSVTVMHASVNEAIKRLKYEIKQETSEDDREFLLTAKTNDISSEIASGKINLTVNILDVADAEGSLRYLGKQGDDIYLCRTFFFNEVRKLYRINVKNGERTLVGEANALKNDYMFIPKVGCCSLKYSLDMCIVEVLNDKNGWEKIGAFPSRGGILKGYSEGEFITQGGDVVVKYDRRGRELNRYSGKAYISDYGVILF